MKDILVITQPSSTASVLFGARLAAIQHARLTVLLPQEDARLGPLALHAGGTTLEARLAEERAELAATAKTNAIAAAGETALRWIECDANMDGILRRCHLADLVVVGANDGTQALPPIKFIADLIDRSGRPVIVVPPGFDRPKVAGRVLVGWNGSAQAARAMHDALPIFARAESVDIVIVAAHRPEPGTVPGEALCDHLRQHGVRAMVRVSNFETGPGVDGILLAEAASAGADLLVIGAFGNSRVRDSLLGGVTDALLEKASIPLLLAR